MKDTGKKQGKKRSRARKKRTESLAEEEMAAPPGGLHDPIWAVASFEKCIASDLSYEEARKKLKAMAARDIPGLCIITNTAAKRIGK